MGLRLGLASGKLPLAVEADALTDSWQGRPCSAVDVLVATPGRLMSHLHGTPGITLDSLQMLVSNRHHLKNMQRDCPVRFKSLIVRHLSCIAASGTVSCHMIAIVKAETIASSS